ncbi:MAG: PorT family protein, partial [Bacteroidales bacterium]|nr:PorT family protein [Bacteroidales bacterium]
MALFLLTFFSVKNVQGQVDFLLFGGFNSSKIISEFDSKETLFSEAKANYNVGAGFRFGLGKVLYLQPEVYVTRKGGLEQAFRVNLCDSISQTTNVQSVDAPLML